MSVHERHARIGSTSTSTGRPRTTEIARLHRAVRRLLGPARGCGSGTRTGLRFGRGQWVDRGLQDGRGLRHRQRCRLDLDHALGKADVQRSSRSRRTPPLPASTGFAFQRTPRGGASARGFRLRSGGGQPVDRPEIAEVDPPVRGHLEREHRPRPIQDQSGPASKPERLAFRSNRRIRPSFTAPTTRSPSKPAPRPQASQKASPVSPTVLDERVLRQDPRGRSAVVRVRARSRSGPSRGCRPSRCGSPRRCTRARSPTPRAGRSADRTRTRSSCGSRRPRSACRTGCWRGSSRPGSARRILPRRLLDRSCAFDGSGVVADHDVELPVGSEQDPPAVVVARRAGRRPRGAAGPPTPSPFSHLDPEDLVAESVGGVPRHEDVHERLGRPGGMHRDAQRAPFAVGVDVRGCGGPGRRTPVCRLRKRSQPVFRSR